ncbi:hypothetical protein D3C83_09690 [compost metagenome]
MAVHQLHHLALGDHVGRVRQHLQHAQVIRFHHHLERARIDEIAHQHRGGVAEQRVGRGLPAPQAGFVHDVVVQQRRGMDELDHRGKLVAVRAAVAESARGEQQQHRAQALAPAANDVLRHLADQQHAGIEPGANHAVHGAHIRLHEPAYRLQRHRSAS